MWLLGGLSRRKILLSWLGGVLVACADEAIQGFVPGRGPGLRDVGIDVLGVTLGIVIISLIYLIKQKRKQSGGK
jgi:VanZ family protein